MTPEQCDQLNLSLYRLAYGLSDRRTVFAYVDSLIAAEREACAKVCEQIGSDWGAQNAANYLAAAIRARKEQTQ